jgi:hypothetical protein
MQSVVDLRWLLSFCRQILCGFKSATRSRERAVVSKSSHFVLAVGIGPVCIVLVHGVSRFQMLQQDNE